MSAVRCGSVRVCVVGSGEVSGWAVGEVLGWVSWVVANNSYHNNIVVSYMVWMEGDHARVTISALDYLLAPHANPGQGFQGHCVADPDPWNRETCGIIWQCFILFFLLSCHCKNWDFQTFIIIL